MILGNTLNGVSIGLKTLIDGAQMERASLEWALAMGATRWEAIWCALIDVQRLLWQLVYSMQLNATSSTTHVCRWGSHADRWTDAFQ